ncbi:hypothetical protein SAMN05192561_10252 [Halopenitus malekzadehii]|uniref:Uncharacterized protein n=1 Tax=Halopenitus malekzadehii TaxID=1267564 RepID=A0A1H6IH13_9EURY|nr:hypothetical protein [Halopenitus malekzadehii]SEH45634.1 hypothetical protein SAMN05192561_10252 [Halopenitus malekzadehii]
MPPKPQLFVYYLTAWMLATLIVLTVLNALTLELYFVVALIGLLVVTELTMPVNIQPQWRYRLRWIILAGLIIFGYIVTRRILEILPSDVL